MYIRAFVWLIIIFLTAHIVVAFFVDESNEIKQLGKEVKIQQDAEFIKQRQIAEEVNILKEQTEKLKEEVSKKIEEVRQEGEEEEIAEEVIEEAEETEELVEEEVYEPTLGFENRGLNTDTNKKSIDLDKVLSGGPGKDGIPAINNPTFVSTREARVQGEENNFRGILVSFDGESKFYPYSILVWHEIVNDNIGDNHFVVTFCPLCGTGIVFNREVENEVLEFGVSGLLYESNLLMYDTKTESLWSQSIGRAVVGEFTDTKLEVLPLQLITFKEVRDEYPNAKVLSRETGYERSYGLYPYGDYEESAGLLFPVSVSDTRFFSKEIMYVVQVNNQYIALQHSTIKNGENTFLADDIELSVKRDGNQIFVSVDGEILPGYYEMWFSFATHHQEDGVVATRR